MILRIKSDNFDGKYVNITFSPSTGGTININNVQIPYDYSTAYPYGSYSIEVIGLGVVCPLEVIAPTPTPTPTITLSPTPTQTATNTPTPTITSSPTPTPTSIPLDTDLFIGGGFTTYKINPTNYNGAIVFSAGTDIDTTLSSSFRVDNLKFANYNSVSGETTLGYIATTLNGITNNIWFGIIDSNFNRISGNSNLVNNSNNSVGPRGIIRQSSGRQILYGGFGVYQSTSVGGIVGVDDRLYKDTTFTGNSGSLKYVYGVIVLPDESMIIGGDFTTYQGVSKSYLAKIDVDGALDTSWSSNQSSRVRAMGQQSSNNIIIGGDFTGRIKRIDLSGNTDATWTTTANNIVEDIFVLDDDRVIVSGTFTSIGGVSRKRIALLNSDGSVDTSFPEFDSLSNSPDIKNVYQSGSTIFIAGDFSSYSGNSVSTGLLAINDTTYELDPTYDFGLGWEILSTATFLNNINGKLTTSSNSDYYNTRLDSRMLELNTTNAAKSGFTFNDGEFAQNGFITKIKKLDDTWLLVAGSFTIFNGQSINRLVKVKRTDGSLDPTFNIGAGFDGIVSDFYVDSSGKILCVGEFRNFAGSSANRIVRLNSDGSKDTSFNYGVGFNNAASVVISDETYYYIASGFRFKTGTSGGFNRYKNIICSRVCKIDYNGTIDNSFYPDPVQQINDMILDNNDIYIGGNFTSVSGISYNRLVKVDKTIGTPDSSFNISLNAQALCLEKVGNYLYVGGQFSNVQGNANCDALIKIDLTTNTLDTSFVMAGGSNQLVWSIADIDGSLYVAGSNNMRLYNNIDTNGLTKMSYTGIEDTTFTSNYGAGTNGTIYAIAKTF